MLTNMNEEHHDKLDVSEKLGRSMMARLMFERPYQTKKMHAGIISGVTESPWTTWEPVFASRVYT